MAKNSIQINSLAWLSQLGSGDIVFFPLVQSSSYSLSQSRVTHKGIGSRANVGYYRYKDENIDFDISALASNERTFGTTLSRENFATENYVSGEITGYNLSGCKSVLYDTLNNTGALPLHFYSLIDDQQNIDIANQSGYSGFFVKMEDCLLKNLSINASVGSVVDVAASYMAMDAHLLRTGIEYISGINEFYEVVHPKNVLVYLGSGDSDPTNLVGFNIDSLSIELPIDYKLVESFGESKPSQRKLMLPAVGRIVLEGLPVEFEALQTSFLEAEDVCVNMTVLFRSMKIGQGSGQDDYIAIKFPKLYPSSDSINASIGNRLRKSLSFTFFESAELYESGKEGMYILRKVPEEIAYYQV